MKLRIYFLDEYKLCNSLELLNYIDIYRELDKSRNVCWIYILEQSKLSLKEENALNNDENIQSWEIL